jgi:hypothetical protein
MINFFKNLISENIVSVIYRWNKLIFIFETKIIKIYVNTPKKQDLINGINLFKQYFKIPKIYNYWQYKWSFYFIQKKIDNLYLNKIFLLKKYLLIQNNSSIFIKHLIWKRIRIWYIYQMI